MSDITFQRDFMPVQQIGDRRAAQVQQDLDKLLKRVQQIEGVSSAAIIRGADVVVDEKVRWKCLYPRCFGYNSNACCPPHTGSVEQNRQLIHSYPHALIWKMDIPVDHMTGEDWGVKSSTYFLRDNEIAGQIENLAQSTGYYLSVAFGGGPCLQCGVFEQSMFEDYNFLPASQRARCTVLQGQVCRRFLKARPAMEAMGIDVIATFSLLDWKLVFIGGQTNPPERIPCAALAGIVLIG